jgi:putative PIN family toxin of toxin-antitoxin system
MDRPRIVTDTNVLVSGLLWIGLPHQIIRLAENKRIALCLSLSIINELSEVLQRRKFAPRISILNTSSEEIVESLLSITEVIQPVNLFSVIRADPSDNKILDCAYAAHAHYIISGDQHLLKMSKFKNILILSPQKFINICAQKGE